MMIFRFSRRAAYGVYALMTFAALAMTASAQDKDWRPIAPEELQAKTPVVEPDADAEALFWEVKIDNSSSDGFTRKHYVRVKIFTERGREKFSKFDIPFLKGLKIRDLAARVVKPDGSSVEIGKDDIFEREIVRASGLKVKAKSFAVPGIEPGVIVEYRYKESFGFGADAQGSKLEFQKDIPVRSLTYYYKPFEGKPETRLYNFNDTQLTKGDNGYYVATRTNIPAFRSEPRMPPEDNVRPWMQLTGISQARALTGAGQLGVVKKDPSDPRKYWGAVAAQYTIFYTLMADAAKEVKKITEEVVQGAATDEEKARKIYDHVQKNIKNTTYDPTLTDEMREKLPEFKSYKEMLKSGSGPSFRIDLLFGAMAIAAGLDTRIVLAGKSSEMMFDPNMTNDDLVSIAGVAVTLGGTPRLLSPGIKYAAFGELPWNRTDVYALAIGQKDYNWSRTPYVPHDRSVARRTGKFKLNEDGSLEGTASVELTGLLALSYRLDNYDESVQQREESLRADIKRRLSQAEITNVTIENIDDTSKPVVQKFNVRVPNYAQKTGKRLFFQPGFFEAGAAPVFTDANRKYDIVFPYPWSEKDSIELTFPSTFALDSGESPAPLQDNGKIGLDKVTISLDRGRSTIVYDRDFYFGGGGITVIRSASYTPLKGLFDAFNKIDTHQLSLKQSQ